MSEGIRRLGDRAFLVELPDLEAVWALHAALVASRPEGIEDIVPAARTIAVLVAPRSADAARSWIERTLRGMPWGAASEGAGDHAVAGEVVVLDVVYDGEDLTELAQLLDVSPERLVQRHTDATWRVAFNGFAPGFGYLVTRDAWFDVPRRERPRTRVPAGAVGLAGGFSGAYPREGPGGWQLIGRTDAPLWTPHVAHPALLTPGTTVRFRAVDALAVPDPVAPSSGAPTDPALTVLRSGPQLLVEDLGRVGAASIGAGRSGALDRSALRLANRLVGNHEGAAALEVLVGAELRFEQATWFAVTGARGDVRLGGHPIEPDAAVRAEPGDILNLGAAVLGLRYVVALRGGVAVPLELGSAAVDIGAGLGGAPLADGAGILLGDDTAGDIPAIDTLTVGPPPDDEVDVRVIAGPREDWFAPASVDLFYDTEWEVTQEANRVGVRLRSPRGATLGRSGSEHEAELPSEPMVPGAVQVPPSGEPTVLLADGPVTGGYPVIAVVGDADLDLFAQLRPGQRVRFWHH